MKTIITATLLAVITASSVFAAPAQDTTVLKTAQQLSKNINITVDNSRIAYDKCDSDAFGRLPKTTNSPAAIAKSTVCKVGVHNDLVQKLEDLTGIVFSGTRLDIQIAASNHGSKAIKDAASNLVF